MVLKRRTNYVSETGKQKLKGVGELRRHLSATYNTVLTAVLKKFHPPFLPSGAINGLLE